jgi:uncharacterized protein (TIGR00369 family)
MLKQLEMLARGEAPPPAIADLIGFTLTHVEPGQAVIELEAGAQHANPMGTLHGGVICTIADSAMGLAYASTLAEGETFTTVELKINFLRPVWRGRLTAHGRFVKGGHLLGLTECDVTDAEGRLVARASSTCMTLRGERAGGEMPATARGGRH